MSQMIPQATIDAIRKEVNIVDVVGEYVQLKKSGKNYLGLCPFHDEKTPSFSVAEDKQIYHCFGCGKGGSVFKFVQEIEGLSFPEAVEKVGSQTSIDLPTNYATEASQGGHSSVSLEERQVLEIHQKVTELYHHILMNTQIGEKALVYLHERGLTDEMIETFQIGFAPKDRRVVHQILQKDNYSEEVLKETGLLFMLDSGEWLDRFYQRIMFPIKNYQGKVIGFSGRILEDELFDSSDQPKYLNSPETNLFNKRFVLYNFHQARPVIRKSNEIILFEGFMDVISAWMSGIENGVATMGTSLTIEQIKAMERVATDVLICYDGDNAGQDAINRAVHVIQEESTLDIQIIRMPERMDPDDYRRQYGPKALKELLHASRETIFQFKNEFIKKQYDLSIESDKLAYIDDILTELSEVDSVIERDLYVTKLSEEFGLSKESLQSELNQKKVVHRQGTTQRFQQTFEPVIPQFQDIKKISLVEKAELQLIYRLMNERNVHNFLAQQVNFSFVHDIYQELYLHISDYMGLHGELEIADFIDYLQEDALKHKVVSVSLQNYSEESSVEELKDCVKIISTAAIQKQMEEQQKAQQEAQRMGNKELEFEATFNIITLQKELKNILN